MGDIVYLPPSGAGGGGPEDTMLEKRVETLEGDMKDVKATLSRLEIAFARFEERLSHTATAADVENVRASIARVEGRLSQIPSTWQIVGILAALLFGVASVVFATTNFIGQRQAVPTQQMNPSR